MQHNEKTRDNENPSAHGGTSRRRFVQDAGLLALGASPIAALAATAANEEVTFADGPRPLVKYPG